MKRPPPALMVAISRARLPSLYHLSAGYGRSAPYRRLHQLLPLQPSRRSLRDAAPLTSYFLRSTRQFGLNGAWRQEPRPKRADPESPEAANERAQFSRSESQKKPPAESSQNNPSETPKSEPESSSGEKAAGEGEQKASEENGKGEEEGEGKDDKPPPPPPPHGDKTPWQVFTETLKTEFKASKEWNESTKALQSGYQDFTQNPALQKAKSAYEEASKTASSTTSAALKTTGKAIGQSAAWAWETPVAKVVRKGAVVAGSGIEKVTRPVRETEAFKQVKDVIDDGSSSRYGGWLEKEERKRIRALREAQAEKDGLRAPPAEVDPDAGTNVTVHKDAAWKESWRSFRDTSKLFQSLNSLKSTYQESENPLISTARVWADGVAGFFAENETAMVIKRLREMDPTFKLDPFMQEMREYILPEVLDAYVKGDLETLKQWLSAAQFQVYSALMAQYTTHGLKSDGRILDIRHVDVHSARLLDPGEVPVIIVTARTQEVHVYRNIKTNELAAGMDDKVQQVTYVIGVTRIPEDVNNAETRGWRLIELQKSARDYL